MGQEICLSCFVVMRYTVYAYFGGVVGGKICLSCFVVRRYTVYAYFGVAVYKMFLRKLLS